jgi:hypothetical protein
MQNRTPPTSQERELLTNQLQWLVVMTPLRLESQDDDIDQSPHRRLEIDPRFRRDRFTTPKYPHWREWGWKIERRQLFQGVKRNDGGSLSGIHYREWWSRITSSLRVEKDINNRCTNPI